MNPMKDVEEVAETRSLGRTTRRVERRTNGRMDGRNNAHTDGRGSFSRIKILKPHARLHIIGRKSTKCQVNPMKDVRGVAETSSLGRTAGRTDARNNTHTWTDEGNFYSPPESTSGDNKYTADV